MENTDNGDVRVFQSTLPVRGATDGPKEGLRTNTISIHAPREGSDGKKW